MDVELTERLRGHARIGEVEDQTQFSSCSTYLGLSLAMVIVVGAMATGWLMFQTAAEPSLAEGALLVGLFALFALIGGYIIFFRSAGIWNRDRLGDVVFRPQVCFDDHAVAVEATVQLNPPTSVFVERCTLSVIAHDRQRRSIGGTRTTLFHEVFRLSTSVWNDVPVASGETRTGKARLELPASLPSSTESSPEGIVYQVELRIEARGLLDYVDRYGLSIAHDRPVDGAAS